MTILRNPIRTVIRGPIRSPMQSAFGESVSLSITAPGAYYYLTSASPYDIGSTLIVADSEDVGGNYTVAITLTGGGTLTLSGTTGLTGSGDGTSSLSYSGTLSAWNTALNGADIAGLSDETATMSITMTRDADSEETSRNVIVNAYPALAIVTLDPLDNATGIPYNRRVYTAIFNRAIQAGTGNVVLKLVGGAALETFDIATGVGDQGGDVTIVGNTLLLSPFADLTDNTAHAIQIAATAIDGADIGTGDSFAGIADDTTWSFTCEDTTPTLSAPLDSQTGGTTATAAVTTDRGDGTLWWVVTTSATTPSHAQIKAGQDHTGSAAAADGSQAVTATGSQGVSITGLTAETQYYTHFTQESANDAAATPVSADGFLTPDITEPVLNSSVPADNATGVAVDSTIVLTFDENVILTDGGGDITLRKLDGSWQVVETFSRSTDTTGTGDNGGSISISGAVVTITPGADMAETTTHALQVAADCLENGAGLAYAGITDDTTLNWQTGIADTYAVEGFSPPVVADFENEYYRVGGVDSDFDSMLTYTSGDALSTQTDSGGLLKWPAHNYALQSETLASWTTQGVSLSGSTITADTANNNHDIRTTVPAFPANTQITVEILVTPGTHDAIAVSLRGSGSEDFIAAIFDVTAGSGAATATDNGVNSGVVTSANATLNGDGTYTLKIIGSLNNVTSQLLFVGFAETTNAALDGNGRDTYVGAGTETLDIERAHVYRSDLGGMVDNPDTGDSYVPTTTAAKYLARRGNHVYNGTSFVNKGLLLESEARTNLEVQSADLANAAWAEDNIDTVVQDGTMLGVPRFLVTENTANNYHRHQSAVLTVVSGSVYCVSFLAETNGREFALTLSSSGFADTARISFDPATGTASVDAGTVTDADMLEVDNGVWLCWAYRTCTLNTGSFRYWLGLADGTTHSYTGDDTSGAYFALPQVEVGSTPSSRIPTSGATVTRPAQALSIAAANMSYSATAMSFHMKGTFNRLTNEEMGLYLWYNASNSYLRMFATNATPDKARAQFVNGASVGDMDAATALNDGINASFNIAHRMTTATQNVAVDGTADTEENDTISGIPDWSAKDFGIGRYDNASASRWFNGNITLFRQWDADITDTGIETAST